MKIAGLFSALFLCDPQQRFEILLTIVAFCGFKALKVIQHKNYLFRMTFREREIIFLKGVPFARGFFFCKCFIFCFGFCFFVFFALHLWVSPPQNFGLTSKLACMAENCAQAFVCAGSFIQNVLFSLMNFLIWNVSYRKNFFYQEETTSEFVKDSGTKFHCLKCSQQSFLI